ncbi:hypothetical protein RJT34_26956 [Clitoria ternatea]|uniref:Wall-associated receptor kinase galacturonan-binding domain-containing protein n=1 Tax=Clitoria ternatea TaxID=43366 RepID=A0AAN9F7R7_CLITE
MEDPVCREQSYSCGSLTNISYPFWGLNRPHSCGGGDLFNLKCNGDDNTTSILIDSQSFTVKEINTTAHIMRLVRTDLAHDVCSPQVNDTYLNPSIFQLGSGSYNITIFYKCSTSVDTSFGYFRCGIFRDGVEDELQKKSLWPKGCSRHVQVPVDVPLLNYVGDHGLDFLKQALASGFTVIINFGRSIGKSL